MSTAYLICYFSCVVILQKLPNAIEDVGVSHSELEAESHRTESIAQENSALRSQLEELRRQLAHKEEVDSATTIRQQLEKVKYSTSICVVVRVYAVHVQDFVHR